jgi:bifunctional UDP-N-acetylglucosamine pyrophosphorylase/glucosamine-1-phosphate N-acetyltransferase
MVSGAHGPREGISLAITTNRKTAAVVLAAGKGTRMKSALPKVLHPLAGRPMIGHVLDTLKRLPLERTVVVVGPGMEQVAAAVAPHACVVQQEQLGTGHAVKIARNALAGFSGDVLVVYADTPLVTSGTLEKLLVASNKPPGPAVVVLGMRLADGGSYGRLVRDQSGMLERIVEARDATEAERKINLCNSGFMLAEGALLFELLDQLSNDNAKKEYYLTDVVKLARGRGFHCAVVESHAAELVGINSRAELAVAENMLQNRYRGTALEGGVSLIGPDTVYFSFDTRLGRDVRIGPYVVIGPGVTVEEGAEIRAFCNIEGAHIGKRAVIGPFARLRPGARIGEGAHVGNFVEIKNAVLQPGAKANHLTYLGDAEVGANANIGAGTITCNYDGFEKAKTEIGEGAFIGSNTALVAPVTIGAGAIVGAGSVITENVAPDALAVARGRQTNVPGGAAKFRAKKGKGNGNGKAPKAAAKPAEKPAAKAKLPAKPKAKPKLKPKGRR